MPIGEEKRAETLQALKDLREAGFSDEQIAIGIGNQMPGGTHPSSMSVYRWRNEKTKPRSMFCWAILEMAKQQKESAK